MFDKIKPFVKPAALFIGGVFLGAILASTVM